MRFRFLSIFLVMILVAGLGLRPGLMAVAWGQATDLENQLQGLYDQIEALKASGADVSAELYDQYFAVEAQINPPDEDWRDEGTLDESGDGCPGIQLPLPAPGDSVVVAGETYTANDSCSVCRNRGRDRIYSIDIPQPTRLLMKTCLSGGFDTYLCVYRNSCCNLDSLVVSNDNSSLCGQASLKSAINHCFLDSGRYYIVVDGYNVAANGHYRLAVINIPDLRCGPTPEFPCPEFYGHHEEPVEGSEAVCGQSYFVEEACPAGFCGIIEPSYDIDVYQFILNECSEVTLRVFADATYGHSGFLGGLNSKLRLFAAPACDHPLFMNDDVGGEVEGQPWDTDSQIITTCLRPGTYYAEVSGHDTTTGDYEFTISCQPCEVPGPVGGVEVSSEGGGRYCVSWPSTGAPIYYVWRYDENASGSFILVGTTYETEICETIDPDPGTPTYEVFTDPCGQPNVPDR